MPPKPLASAWLCHVPQGASWHATRSYPNRPPPQPPPPPPPHPLGKSLTTMIQDYISEQYFFSACVADLYEKHRHEDGFLYVAYAGESAFGSTHTNLTTVVM